MQSFRNGLGPSTNVSHPYLRRSDDLSFVFAKARSLLEWFFKDIQSFWVEGLFTEAKERVEVLKRLLQHGLMEEKECVGSSIEGVGNFAFLALLVDDVVDNRDDGPREIVEVKDRRVSIEANGVELVAVLS